MNPIPKDLSVAAARPLPMPRPPALEDEGERERRDEYAGRGIKLVTCHVMEQKAISFKPGTV